MQAMQQYTSFRSKSILAAKGFAMGLADIIPGVSGGTIALISGIYDHLIYAISSVQLGHAWSALELVIFFRNGERRRKALAHLGEIEWRFLIPLLLGIGVAMLIMTRIIPFVLDNYAYHAYAFFFGLILFSISVPFRMMQRRWQDFVVLAIAAIAVYLLVGVSRVSDAKLEFRALPVADAGQETTATSEPNATSEADPTNAAADFTIFTDAKGKWELALNEQTRGRRFRAMVTTARGEPAGSFVLTIPAQSEPAVIDESGLNGLSVALQNEKGPAGDDVLHAGLIAQGTTAPWFVLFSGALAICAMILPGISGAYILVILGQYKLMTSAVRDVIDAIVRLPATGHLDPTFWPALTTVVAFVIGIAIGIFSFVRLLKYVLERQHSITMAVLTGLMIGSLRGIWPVQYLHGETLNGTLIAVGVALAFAGVVVIYALEQISRKIGDPEPPV